MNPALRAGDSALDPMNRRVTVTAVKGDEATVLMGVYSPVTVRYPVSVLRWTMHDDCDNRGGACTRCRNGGFDAR